MKFHNELNPVIWDKENDNQMRPEVLAKLKEIANAFIEYIEIPEDAILDMVVTGSSASYNYNEFSDLDLHIIVDYDKIHEDCPLVEGYLGALKNTFNKEHDIYIHGVPVELYAEKKDQGTVHNGLYSVQNEEWIDRPQKIAPTDNDAAVEAKYNEIKEMVDKCADSEAATELLEKIYAMRKAGLAEAGEFCTENLAFKKLRNEGCMDKLRQLKKEQIDKQLSLESYNEDTQKLNRDDFKIIKTENGLYKVDGGYDSRLGYIKPDKNYMKVDKQLGNAIYKYNTRFTQTDRKALMSKLHKLFKEAGIPKMKDMTSSIRGYRPITQNGYYMDIYAGDRTSFNIGISKSNDEWINKIKEILDQEGINYWEGSDHFSIDMEKQNKNESIKEELNNNELSNLFNSIWDEYEHASINWQKANEKCLDSMKKHNIDERKLRWLIGDVKGLHLLGKLSGDEDWDNELLGCTNESIKEDFEDDCEDCPEEMHKERYVTYFETQEGRQKYTIYHVYTDSTDDSYNELCDKRDNQLGMYNSYKELKDALKEKAEKIAKQQGWTVKSIENLGEDDTYYRERNKFESIKEGFNKGDKVQLKRKNNKIGIVKSIFNGDKDKNDKDIKYLDVEFEDGTKEGRPASDFKKVNESLNEGQSIKKWAQSMLPEIFKLLRKNGIPSKDYCVLGHVEICPNANFLVRKTDVEKVLELLPMAKENEYWDTKGNAASIRIEYDGLREFEKTLKSVNEEYKAGDEITIDGKTGVIDSTFRFAEDDSLLGVWVKFGKEVKYYTLEELNDKSKNEDKEMNEDIKTEYAIINFLKKYGFATQEDLYNNIGAQVFVIDNAVKELLKQDKIKFEDGQGQDGINGWKLTEQIEEDLATLEKKVDKAEQDIQDIIASYTTNESIYAKLDETFKKALGEEVKIDTHSFQFDVDGYNISGVDENGIGFEVGFDADQDIKEVIEEYLDDNAADFFEEDGEITSTEVTKYFYKEEGQIGGFEFNIFFE